MHIEYAKEIDVQSIWWLKYIKVTNTPYPYCRRYWYQYLYVSFLMFLYKEKHFLNMYMEKDTSKINVKPLSC